MYHICSFTATYLTQGKLPSLSDNQPESPCLLFSISVISAQGRKMKACAISEYISWKVLTLTLGLCFSQFRFDSWLMPRLTHYFWDLSCLVLQLQWLREISCTSLRCTSAGSPDKNDCATKIRKPYKFYGIFSASNRGRVLEEHISPAPHISAASAYYLEKAIYFLYCIWHALVTEVQT